MNSIAKSPRRRSEITVSPQTSGWSSFSRLGLIIILAWSFITRFYRLDQPPIYIFDEVYHVVTAKLVAVNDNRAFEWWNPPPEPNTAVDWLHPPLAKYSQAISIRIWGANSFGWRFSSAIFGVGVIWLTYALAKLAFAREDLALLAAGLASLDGLLLTQSRIAMNDIHVTFWILATGWAYVKYRSDWRIMTAAPTAKIKTKSLLRRFLWLTGLLIGLAISTKWSGVFIWGVIWLVELIRLIVSQSKMRTIIIDFCHQLIILGLIPIIIYLASYAQMFWQGKSLWCGQAGAVQGECYYESFDWLGQNWWGGYVSHFAELHRQIWYYQTHLTASHDYQSRPWQWFLNLRPVWYHVQYLDPQQMANIYAFGNPLLMWLGAGSIALSLLTVSGRWLMMGWVKAMAFWQYYQRGIMARSTSRSSRSWSPTLSTLSPVFHFILVGYFSTWIFWQLSPRIMCFYHYTPAVPWLAIILAWWLIRLQQTQWRFRFDLLVLIVSAVLMFFIIWYPHWTALPVKKSFASAVYFALPEWK